MTNDDFKQWAAAMVEHHDPCRNEAFAKELEQADKGAAAHVRKCNAAVTDLVKYLATKLG